MGRVIIRMENVYEDGHESERILDVSPPPPTAWKDEVELDAWWEEVVWPETGDGHGIGKDLGYCHVATIIGGDVDQALVGKSTEWAGS